MSWSLTDELCERTSCVSIEQAAIALGLVEPDAIRVQVSEDRNWYRSGDETYLYEFSVAADGRRCRFVLKACVALGEGGTAAVSQSWVDRRRHLASLGIATPTYFGLHKSTLLEEYIPFTFPEALRLARRDSGSAPGLAAELGMIAGVLTREGYPTLQLTDLRSRGGDVVMIDFGSDLGPAGISSRNHSATLDDFLGLLELDVPPPSDELQALIKNFEKHLYNGR